MKTILALLTLLAAPLRADYLIIDLSGGVEAEHYPVSKLAAPPEGGWTDEYKTDKLVLRRIEPGTRAVEDTASITLTEPVYIGIFQITYQQWKHIMGEWKPIYKITEGTWPIRSTNTDIRGNTGDAVDSGSFIGRLRAKTGLAFDLPTEAQWKYVRNTPDRPGFGKGERNPQHAPVGSRPPDAQGLYDTGNVYEWNLDQYTAGIWKTARYPGAYIDTDHPFEVMTNIISQPDALPKHAIRGFGLRLACPPPAQTP